MDAVQDEAVGCTCPQGPVYYVVVREGRKAYKQRVGRNRRDAERALRKIAVSVDDGAYRPQENIGFSDWADQWLVSLERKPSTVDSYRSTINLAKEAFANKRVRRLGPRTSRASTRACGAGASSTSTRAKHLRVLGACLQAAYRHRYAAANPVRELHPALKPRPERKEAAYFENDELPRLFAELDDGSYRTVCLIALKTGMRQGEILGLCGATSISRSRNSRAPLYTGGTRAHRRTTSGVTSISPQRSSSSSAGGGANVAGRQTHARLSGGPKDRVPHPPPLLGELYAAMERARRSARRADWREADIPQLPPHISPSEPLRAARRSPGSRVTSATAR